MKTFAIIESGNVVNTILWDGASPYQPAGAAVDITSMTPQPCIGWTYDGSTFTAPAAPAPLFS